MRHFRHVAIAGGGVIGLSCALLLRQRGLEVTVLEAGTAMKEASWSAGGMLAVDDPENPAALLLFSRYSRSLYERFIEELQALSGERVTIRTRETLQVLPSGQKADAGYLLSREEALSLVPGLNTAIDNCLLLEEASIDPRDLCAALPSAVRAAGVNLREASPVMRTKPSHDGVLVTTPHGALHADVFVNCCGAWAGSLDGFPGIVPRKGQMLVIEQPATLPLTRVLRSPEIYLIPRGDGRIVIGATVEDAGYSKAVEPEALMMLRRRAAELWPPAMNARQVDSWAGLRPGTADELPVVGQCEKHGAPQYIAAGHHRNGILLAPGTAHVIADLVCGASPAIDIASFAPHRPSITTVCDKHFAAAL